MEIPALPDDVLVRVFKFLDVSSVAICREVCLQWKQVTDHSGVWKAAVYNEAEHIPDFEIDSYRDRQTGATDWHHLAAFRGSTKQRAKGLRDKLAADDFILDEDCVPLSDVLGTRQLTRLEAYLLTRYLSDIPRSINHEEGDLTEDYYNRQVLNEVSYMSTLAEMKCLRRMPRGMAVEIVERGAILVAGWNNPHIVAQSVQKQLDELAETLKNQFIMDPTDPRRTIESFGHAYVSELGFGRETGGTYDADGSFIDIVLARKQGLPIILCAIYAAVARRCGIDVEFVNFPQVFLCRYRVSDDQERDDDNYVYIDCYREAKLMTRREAELLISMPGLASVWFRAAEGPAVVCRMFRNLLRIYQIISVQPDKLYQCLNFIIALAPQNVDEVRLQGQLVLAYKPNRSNEAARFIGSLLEDIEGRDDQQLSSETEPDVMQFLRQLHSAFKTQAELNRRQHETNLRNAVLLQKLRDPGSAHEYVKFCVGMVMKHRRYNYKCVIRSWDPGCQQSNEWIFRMGVRSLERGTEQPFYHVLVEDGSMRYAAEDNLEICETFEDIPHKDIGRYFSRRVRNFYIPNSQLRKFYPQDDPETLIHQLSGA
eukprot:Clim_evm86s172 gene=Clim_evmTU86s172